jgi:hypothetical protein
MRSRHAWLRGTPPEVTRNKKNKAVPKVVCAVCKCQVVFRSNCLADHENSAAHVRAVAADYQRRLLAQTMDARQAKLVVVVEAALAHDINVHQLLGFLRESDVPAAVCSLVPENISLSHVYQDVLPQLRKDQAAHVRVVCGGNLPYGFMFDSSKRKGGDQDNISVFVVRSIDFKLLIDTDEPKSKSAESTAARAIEVAANAGLKPELLIATGTDNAENAAARLFISKFAPRAIHFPCKGHGGALCQAHWCDELPDGVTLVVDVKNAFWGSGSLSTRRADATDVEIMVSVFRFVATRWTTQATAASGMFRQVRKFCVAFVCG